MVEADVVISWSFASVPKAVQALFTRPTRFVAISTPPKRSYKAQVAAMGGSPIRHILKQYASDVVPLRVACLGFSESCHGVRNLLGSPDGLNFDAALAIDGVHTAFGPNKGVETNTMKPWLEFAKYAVVNERLLVITHSSIKPPTFASTTQTADWLWKTVTGDDKGIDFSIPDFHLQVPPRVIKVGAPPAKKPYSVNYPQDGSPKPVRRADGLVVLGYNNLDIPAGYADHIWQAKAILPAVLEKILAARWNTMDPHNSATWSS